MVASSVRSSNLMNVYIMVNLKYHFMDESFEFEIWHTCYQFKYNFMKKISWQKKSVQSLGGWQSCQQ